MKEKEVPQDAGLLGDLKEVRYAVDERGRYVPVPSAGWEPTTVANAQAWDAIRAQVASVLDEVRAGRLSPLAWRMAAAQMDPGLLARYAGLFAWQVRRHMRPGPFRRLSRRRVARYAAVFGIAPEELGRVPESA